MEKKLKIDLRNVIKKLEIVTRELVTSRVIGGYKSKFKGKGLEFDSYGDYSNTEDSSDIDWRASLRAGKLLVKEYIEERNLEVFFLVDVSSSMVYGSIQKLKSEFAAEVVASLSYAILRAGDSVGLGLFSDKVVKNIPLSKNMNQFYILSSNLINPSFYGGGYDLAAVLKFLTGYLRKNAVLMIVSDFIGLKGEWRKYVEIAASKFDLIGIMIRDPLDMELPDEKHTVLMEDPFSDNQILVVPRKIKKEYSTFVRMSEKAMKEAFLRAGADFVRLNTSKPFTDDLVTFFKVRKRRLV
ncbi:DUF58 domain-containing protein [Candidatus Woesearchaeota archaeon]|nr:DUF58 domain-containing protein [Candidatus Woesearchaeota archaeon]